MPLWKAGSSTIVTIPDFLRQIPKRFPDIEHELSSEFAVRKQEGNCIINPILSTLSQSLHLYLTNYASPDNIYLITYVPTLSKEGFVRRGEKEAYLLSCSI